MELCVDGPVMRSGPPVWYQRLNRRMKKPEEKVMGCHLCRKMNSTCQHSREPGASVSNFSPSKTGKPLKLALVIAAILLFAFIGLTACSGDESEDSDSSSEFSDSSENENDLEQEDNAYVEDTEESPSDDNNAEQTTLDELTALVQQSQSATVELVRDPDSRQSLNTDADEAIATFKAHDFEIFKQDFIPDYFQPIADYPFYYLPEYRVTFDTGVSYTIMQEHAGENKMAIMQFDGNSSLWYAPNEFYLRTNVIRTTLMDDFSNMHIFCTDSDEKAAMNAVLNHGLVESFALGYYIDSGFGFEGQGIYHVDDLMMGDMPDTDPNLHWALIQYSVKPSSDGTLPDNMNIYMEDGWIKGGLMLAAVWNDTCSEGVRSYLLGITPFEYDVNGTSEAEAALALYEQSYVTSLSP